MAQYYCPLSAVVVGLESGDFSEIGAAAVIFPIAVARRLRVYQTETFPLLDYYRQRGLLIEVPGVGGVEQVNQWVLSALDQSPVDPD